MADAARVLLVQDDQRVGADLLPETSRIGAPEKLPTQTPTV